MIGGGLFTIGAKGMGSSLDSNIFIFNKGNKFPLYHPCEAWDQYFQEYLLPTPTNSKR